MALRDYCVTPEKSHDGRRHRSWAEARQLDMNIVSQTWPEGPHGLMGPLGRGPRTARSWETTKVFPQRASCWTLRLSHAFAQASADNGTAPKPAGRRPPGDELMNKAKGMHGAALSYRQIETNLGISKATARRLVNLETARA